MMGKFVRQKSVFTATNEISWILLTMTIKLMLSRLLIRLVGTSMNFLNIDNLYSEGMVNQICPSEPQLNKAITTDTEATFLDLHLSTANEFVSSKIDDCHNKTLSITICADVFAV